MGCHSLLQGISLTQGLNFGLMHCRQILYHLSHQGSPITVLCELKQGETRSQGDVDTKWTSYWRGVWSLKVGGQSWRDSGENKWTVLP